ncbi:YCF48-related protein [Nevskia sp.]|uniref:WD40/YVTN/BNR-like repeat-containing protein n=1 Tax=Nevskia sp. TaxID=1929292 RepID=UPI0025EA84AE|nr:YCF48-related protein [Nevskia sp.]
MRLPNASLSALILALALAPLSLLVRAQDEPAAEPAVAEEAPAEAPAEAEAAAPAAKPITARPSEMAVKATSNPLLKVVSTGKQFVAVGAHGHVLTSADGKDWKQVASPVDALLTSVTFADAQHGWAVGHDATILATSDGGATWKLQNFQPDLGKPLFDVIFFDPQNGLAVGAYGLMLTTSDGGASWTQVPVNPVTEGERHFNALTRLGDGSLMVVGEAGLIGLSPDRGQTWTKIAGPYESSLFCVIAAGDKGALIGGLRGNSFFTADVAAAAWSKIETGTDQSLFGMAAIPGDKVAMVGLNATLLIFDTAGKTRLVPITDRAGNKQTDTLSWVMPIRDGTLLVVGDAGVQRLDATKF